MHGRRGGPWGCPGSGARLRYRRYGRGTGAALWQYRCSTGAVHVGDGQYACGAGAVRAVRVENGQWWHALHVWCSEAA